MRVMSCDLNFGPIVNIFLQLFLFIIIVTLAWSQYYTDIGIHSSVFNSRTAIAGAIIGLLLGFLVSSS